MDDCDPTPDPAPGKRVAQLLASEVEGQAGRGLGPLAVVDARPEADPAPEGALAYRVVAGDRQRPVATVLMYPDRAEIVVESGDGEAARAAAADADLSSSGESGSPLRIAVPDGGAVKRALPVLAAAANAPNADGPD
jgi:hypothetical protein